MSAAAILLDKVSIIEQGGGLDLENPGTSKSHVAELTNTQAQLVSFCPPSSAIALLITYRISIQFPRFQA